MWRSGNPTLNGESVCSFTGSPSALMDIERNLLAMTEKEAIEIAKTVAEQAGWGWYEPIEAEYHAPWFGKWGGAIWKVEDCVGERPPHVRVLIDDHTGKILEKHCIEPSL